ncbi:MAG TPA: hypothetical protein VFX17_00195 [Patescibacteria group bacterium]|nr:hypothetical protein [Patescibacteria group bacterium]
MRKLLFINPDPTLAAIYKRSLLQHFDVEETESGLEGLRLAKLSHPEIIVSEYVLPDIAVSSLLQQLRRNPRHISTPVIILSRRAPTVDALNWGAQAWHRTAETGPELFAESCLKFL